jgi:Ca-activated chloride channel homolog
MHFFAKPEMLFWLLLLPLCSVFLSITWYRKTRALQRFGSAQLVRKLVAQTSFNKQIMKRILLLVAMLFVILSLAHPRWGELEEEVERMGIDILVALDTSTSMLAEDIKPNRLAKARAEIRGLVSRLEGDRIGIINFAGEALVQCPLTLDYSAALIMLDEVAAGSIAMPGTNLSAALKKSLQTFVAKENKYKILILMTDGENTIEDPLPVAKELAKAGVKVFTIGIGNPNGTPIPVRDEKGQLQYKRDKQGKLVQSKLDERILRAIAYETDGVYFRASAGEFELDRIYEDIRAEEEKELHSQVFSRKVERYRWFLIPALLLLVWEMLVSERRSALVRSEA